METKNNNKIIVAKKNIDINIFHSLFENSLSGILYGNPDDGNVLDANPAAAEMFGYAIEELKTLNRNDVFDFKHHTMINLLNTRKKTGKAAGELIGIRKNGERFPCEVTSSIFKNEKGENRTSTILNDITERRKTDEGMSLLLSNTEESFVLINMDLKIVSFNKKFKDQYELLFNKKVFKGDYIIDYAQEERKNEVKENYKKVFKGESIVNEIKIPSINNEFIYYINHYKPALDYFGNIIGAFITSRDITEKRKAQQLIITNEKRFRSIIEHTGDLISMTDENGIFIYISPSVERFVGLSKDEIINKSYQFAIHPDYLQESKSVLNTLLTSPGVPIHTVTKILHRDGYYIWVEGYVTNLLHDENIKAIVSNYRDISEKVELKSLQEFEQRNKEALINTTEDLIWSVSKDFKLIAGNKSFIEMMKKHINVYLKEGDDLLLSNFFEKYFIDFWKGMYQKALLGESFKQEIFSPKRNNFPKAWTETSFNPIYHESEIVGVACYLRDITEKKNAFFILDASKEELRNSHDQLKKLTDDVDAVIYQFEISPEGKMTFPFVSKSIHQLVPNINIELLKTDASHAFAKTHPDDLNLLLMSIDESRQNLTDWNLEYRSIGLNDDLIWIKGKSRPYKKENGTIVWYGYLLDITEQKISAEKLRISKERYDIIAKATNDTIWDIDIVNNTKIWNKGIVEIFGYSENETNINDQNWWFSKIHPDDIENIKKLVNEWKKTKTPRFEHDYRFLCADGTYKYVHDRGYLVLNEKNEIIRIIGAMQDITARKLAEDKYFESELRFKKIFEADPECVKLVSTDGKLIEMNKAGLGMLEADSIEEVNNHLLVNFVLPKYRDAYSKFCKHVMFGNEGYLEYETLGLRGTKTWMETNAVPIRDINGSVTLMLGVTRNITKRKQEEHHLKLLESVITNTNDSIMITEAEPFDEPGPRIVFVNEAFTRMTGYTVDEVVGKSPRILQGPKTDKEELKRMGESMREWKPCEVTVINYKKNGDEFWINFSVKPIADETGWFTHWIAVERDVTQQKNSEQEREHIISELSQNNKDLKQFSYVTSHNLRAPIANLLGLTSLIDHYKVPNKSLKQILDGIKQSALIFDDTVKDLTQVLVIKDQTNIVKEEVSFVTVIDNVLRQLSISLDDNSIKINYEFKNAPFITFTNA